MEPKTCRQVKIGGREKKGDMELKSESTKSFREIAERYKSKQQIKLENNLLGKKD